MKKKKLLGGRLAIIFDKNKYRVFRLIGNNIFSLFPITNRLLDGIRKFAEILRFLPEF